MPVKRGGPNHLFVLAARHLASSPEHRGLLVAEVKKLAGNKTADRLSIYNSLVPFLEDFGNAANGSGVTENDRLEYIYSEVLNGRIAWPIPALLSWVSYYHSAAAEALFSTTGLNGKHGIVYRPYIGEPGDWAGKKVEAALAPKVDTSLAHKRRTKEQIPKRGTAPNELKTLRRDISNDSKRIAKNKLYIKQLISVVASIAAESGISIEELSQEIDRSMANHRHRATRPQSRMSRLPPRSRWNMPARGIRDRQIDMRDPAFISKAIGWLSAKHPSTLVAYYEEKGLSLIDLHPDVFQPMGLSDTRR